MKFTIATCTYNAAIELPVTLKSVLEQTYPNIEHLIIDGASKDHSDVLFKQYIQQNQESNNGHVITLISEADKGLYDAMNKALNKATGDYILFLNAGDVFHASNTLEKIAEAINASSMAPGVVYGHTDIVNAKGEFVRKRRLEPPSQLSWKSFKLGMLVCHQAFFASTKLTDVCHYDLSYRFSADFDWCIRLMKMAHDRQMPLLNSHCIVSDFLEGGMTKKNHRKSLWERFDIMVKHYGLVSTIFYHMYFVLRGIVKR